MPPTMQRLGRMGRRLRRERRDARRASVGAPGTCCRDCRGRVCGPLALPGRGRKPPVEWQADQFAACLLMPARLVRTAVLEAFDGRLPSWEGIEARHSSGEPDERFIEVASDVLEAGRFDNVSNMAMRIPPVSGKLSPRLRPK